MAILHQQAQLTLTPTARLSRRLAQQHALAVSQAGTTAWLPAQIFSFTAWLAALRHEYFLASDDDRTPMDTQQALQLWQRLIQDDVFIGSPRVADLAQSAWRLLQEHALQAPQDWPALMLSEDNRHFQAWAQRYQHICAQQKLVDEWAFAAELPEHIASGKLRIPDVITLHGFELALTPLQQRIVEAFANAGSNIEQPKRPSAAAPPQALQVQQFATADAELVGAAQWARDQLEANANQSIAIVVPDLNGRVDRVERTLRQVFDPRGFALQQSGSEPWHISLGKPLAQWPLVTAALDILGLNNNRFSQPQIFQLLRSPFLPGWVDERPQRHQAIVNLANRAPYFLTGQELMGELNVSNTDHEEDSLLATHINAWRTARRDFQDSARPSHWAKRFQQELSSIGFGQGRGLNSREYQVLQRWHDLLEEFSRLDMVSNGPLTREDALQTIRERAMGTVFRERNTGVPIEVLGVAEALGSNFDALWITTLDSATWPGSLRRDPLIPGVAQAGVASASSEGCLDVARQELRGLLASAPSLHASFARGSEEIAMQVAGLLGPLEVLEVDLEETLISAPMEIIATDDQAPAYVADGLTRGGTGILRNQSACPFRAFAEQRLGATDTAAPRPGLNNAQRGTIVHYALENFWQDISGSQSLRAMSPDAVAQKIEQAVTDALAKFTNQYLLTLNDPAKRLEQQRTERLVHRWLEIESRRGDFEIQAREQTIPISISGLNVEGKIDRIDQLANGDTLLIDYKTGKSERSAWFPEARIADPQLPTYAMVMQPQPNAIAFAQLKPEKLGFTGLSEAATGIDGISELAATKYKFSELEAWSELLDGWQTSLHALAKDFQSGQAAVDPIDANACKYCHLHALCRVNERAPFLSESLDENLTDNLNNNFNNNLNNSGEAGSSHE